MTPALRTRAFIAAGLALVAAVLFLLERSGTPVAGRNETAIRTEIRSMEAVLDSVLRRHGITRDQVRTWQVRTPDRRFLRTERRITVPPDFVSVQFNRDLNQALDGTDIRAAATERTRENTVTVHLKKGATIIESITFIMDRRMKRKEQAHQ